MTLSDWLDAERGRLAATAAHFQLTQSAVSQWRTRVPTGRMKALRDFTNGDVSLEEMLPVQSQSQSQSQSAAAEPAQVP